MADKLRLQGTFNFMSIETITRAYRFGGRIKRCPFFHNSLHDMESVIWVDFAILLNVRHGDVDIRDEIVFKLFSGDQDKAAERQVFLSGAHETDRYYADLLGAARTGEQGSGYPGPAEDGQSGTIGLHTERLNLRCLPLVAKQEL